MKEIVHFTKSNSTVCETMVPVLEKFFADNPDIHYSKVDVDEDEGLYGFYSKKYDMPVFPAFLGLVDGKLHQAHLGSASALILKSLVN
jgi:thiol-disulfide isomerase/thioredoxin